MKKFRMALIGVGARGDGLYHVSLKQLDYVDYVAVCDLYMDRCEKMADQNGFVVVRNVLYSYYGKDTNVTIPDGITSIGDSAFYN